MYYLSKKKVGVSLGNHTGWPQDKLLLPPLWVYHTSAMKAASSKQPALLATAYRTDQERKKVLHTDGTLEVTIPDAPSSTAPAPQAPRSKGSKLIRAHPLAPSKTGLRAWKNTPLKPCPLHKALQSGCGIRSAKTTAMYYRSLAELRRINSGQPVSALLQDVKGTLKKLMSASRQCNWSTSYTTSLLASQLACIRHTISCQSKAQPKVKAAIAQLQAEYKKLQLQSRQPMIQNAVSERQAAGFVPYQELVKAQKRLPQGSKASLLLAFATMVPPCRGGDLAALKLYQGEPSGAELQSYEGNYLVLPFGNMPIQPYICYRQYKCSRIYGTVKVAVPKCLLQVFEASFKEAPRQWLFPMARDPLVPYKNRTAFSKWACQTLQRVLGVPQFNWHIARHAHISHSHALYDTSKLDCKDHANIALYNSKLAQIARCMMHSLDQARQYVYSMENGQPKPVDLNRIQRPARPSDTLIQVDLLTMSSRGLLQFHITQDLQCFTPDHTGYSDLH
jgi:hypothetical protein